MSNPYANKNIPVEQEFEGWQGARFADAECPLVYRIKFPADINDGKLHPLVLTMHGAGSIGDDNLRQLFLAELFASHAPIAENSPILVAPQCPSGKYWIPSGPQWNAEKHPFAPYPTAPLAVVIRLMEKILAENPVDFSRIYLVGASMGGFACWELLMRREWFAAAVIICGGGDPTQVGALMNPALRLFHGDADTVVPARNSREMLAAVKAVGIQAEYTEFPGVDHDSWTPALTDPATGKWLFAQRQRQIVSVTMPENPQVLELNAYGFSARIAPEIGGNLFSLRDEKSGTKLLREPLSLTNLAHAAVCFGIPTLLPPNRIDGGRFTFNGRAYVLPVTDTRNNNHLHGLAAGRSFKVIRHDAQSALLQFDFNADDERFAGFPHAFTVTHEYCLDETGLTDATTITNHSNEEMPLGLGFHTAFPAENLRLRLGTAKFRYEIGERVLPTGKKLTWREYDPRQFFSPFGFKFDFHAPQERFTATSGIEIRGAELQYPQGTLTYEVDEKFGFWYVWNAGGFNKFICLEPVSWMSNALNQQLPAKTTGVRSLAAGASATFVNRLRWKRA